MKWVSAFSPATIPLTWKWCLAAPTTVEKLWGGRQDTSPKGGVGLSEASRSVSWGPEPQVPRVCSVSAVWVALYSKRTREIEIVKGIWVTLSLALQFIESGSLTVYRNNETEARRPVVSALRHLTGHFWVTGRIIAAVLSQWCPTDRGISWLQLLSPRFPGLSYTLRVTLPEPSTNSLTNKIQPLYNMYKYWNFKLVP